MKTVLLATGQGSQYVGMMKDFYGEFANAKKLINYADEILGYKISEICFDGPAETLKETRYTQPALFLHAAVTSKELRERLSFDATAGHSVGEYAALYAADVLDFESALQLVALRGKLMFEAGEHTPGTMFAVIGLQDEKVEDVCKTLTENAPDGEVIVPANYNCPGQIVVSGSADYLRSNAAEFKKAGAKIVKELTVSGAFHSPLMLPAKLELEEAIRKTDFHKASVPVYANVSAEPLSDAEAIKQALVKQLTSPVLWTQSVRRMHTDGITRFIETGPGKVLQGLVKRILKDVEIYGIDKTTDLP